MTAVPAPLPLDLSHHFSYAAKNRTASSVKGFYKYFAIPGIANFAGGMTMNLLPFVKGIIMIK